MWTLPSAAPLNSDSPNALLCSAVMSASCAFHSALGAALPGAALLLAAAGMGMGMGTYGACTGWWWITEVQHAMTCAAGTQGECAQLLHLPRLAQAGKACQTKAFGGPILTGLAGVAYGPADQRAAVTGHHRLCGWWAWADVSSMMAWHGNSGGKCHGMAWGWGGWAWPASIRYGMA